MGRTRTRILAGLAAVALAACTAQSDSSAVLEQTAPDPAIVDPIVIADPADYVLPAVPDVLAVYEVEAVLACTGIYIGQDLGAPLWDGATDRWTIPDAWRFEGKQTVAANGIDDPWRTYRHISADFRGHDVRVTAIDGERLRMEVTAWHNSYWMVDGTLVVILRPAPSGNG